MNYVEPPLNRWCTSCGKRQLCQQRPWLEAYGVFCTGCSMLCEIIQTKLPESKFASNGRNGGRAMSAKLAQTKLSRAQRTSVSLL
jgi:hypothetical protein